MRRASALEGPARLSGLPLSFSLTGCLLLASCTSTLEVTRKNLDGTASSQRLQWTDCSGDVKASCASALEHVQRAIGIASLTWNLDAERESDAEMQEAALDLEAAVKKAIREDEAHGNHIAAAQVAFNQSIFYELNGQLCDGYAKSAAERAQRSQPQARFEGRIKYLDEQAAKSCVKPTVPEKP